MRYSATVYRAIKTVVSLDDSDVYGTSTTEDIAALFADAIPVTDWDLMDEQIEVEEIR